MFDVDMEKSLSLNMSAEDIPSSEEDISKDIPSGSKQQETELSTCLN